MGEFSTGRSFQCLPLRKKNKAFILLFMVEKVVFFLIGGQDKTISSGAAKGFRLSSFKSGENRRYLFIKPTSFVYLIFHGSCEETFALKKKRGICAPITIIVSSRTAVKSQLKTYFENTSGQCEDVIRCITHLRSKPSASAGGVHRKRAITRLRGV